MILATKHLGLMAFSACYDRINLSLQCSDRKDILSTERTRKKVCSESIKFYIMNGMYNHLNGNLYKGNTVVSFQTSTAVYETKEI